MPRSSTRDKRATTIALAKREGLTLGPHDELAIEHGCYLDMRPANRVREFFHRFLRHSKGQWSGQRFQLQDWQWRDVILPIFGWRDAMGLRRYRRGYLEVPKKNGKSTLFSGLSLYFLVADGEPGAEVYSAAADRDQAAIIYHEAVNMAEQCPMLYRNLDCIRSTKRIVYPAGRGILRALSADVPTKHGLNASAVLFDELHTQRNRDLWDTLFYAGASRRQPFQFAISTAGFDRESLCYEQHKYAQGVLDGTVMDWTYFALLYGADVEDDWTSEETWKKANPSYGVTMDPGAFAADCREAQQSIPRQNAFRRLRLDQWTEQDERWLDIEAWDDCGPFPEDLELAGRPCFGGLDLASTTDIAALVLAFPIDDNVVLLEHFWVPENHVRRRAAKDKVPYDEWVSLGELRATPGDVIDYDYIRRDINSLNEKYHIREIAIDRWNATQLAVQLEHDGLAMVKFGQGFASMNAPTKKLDELVVSRRLRHNGGRVLRWMARNVALERDAADNWKPSKKRSPERIDGIVAAIMAIDRATTQPSGSVYESRGMLEL